jgi:hypothetical protein
MAEIIYFAVRGSRFAIRDAGCGIRDAGFAA